MDQEFLLISKNLILLLVAQITIQRWNRRIFPYPKHLILLPVAPSVVVISVFRILTFYRKYIRIVVVGYIVDQSFESHLIRQLVLFTKPKMLFPFLFFFMELVLYDFYFYLCSVCDIYISTLYMVLDRIISFFVLLAWNQINGYAELLSANPKLVTSYMVPLILSPCSYHLTLSTFWKLLFSLKVPSHRNSCDISNQLVIGWDHNLIHYLKH
jgi:hypothetical protein